ncbi:MAG: 4-hydroxy-tetrahydrodipicolinate reductase [Ruminococcaceae bacterium]|nr:4-hydroxy-tetrahydrodipicolinate reductase [Oscillospiraceae bacterium]HHV32589.1 4-hydroxy-tetrahydrodipicolinate reductase [Clostridiales bacterium]
MIRIILSGCNGKMGRVITDCAAQSKDCRIVCGIDKNQSVQNDYPVYSNPSEITETADVIIDFSHPALLSSLLDYALSRQVPIVLCTTGYDKDQVKQVEQAAEKIPVFYSRNMSLGVNLLIELSRKAAQVLGKDFDIEIIEQHHNQKVDAPSGTALMIADEISSVREGATHYMYDRHSQRKKRDPSEIGIHSVRGGTIVGEHEVIFAGQQEVITLSHSAQSKEIFANGAINAAHFLVKQPAGLYQMSDLLR